MEKMAQFFDWINDLLGVEGPGELIFHPVFIGLCIAVFLYCLIKGWKLFAVAIYLILAGGVIFSYLYPEDASDLHGLLTFLGAMGAVVLIGVYFGFIRE